MEEENIKEEKTNETMESINSEGETEKGKMDLKTWMKEHPAQYARMAERMGGKESIRVIQEMGKRLFDISPEVKDRIEGMMTTGVYDMEGLLKATKKSGFIEEVICDKSGEIDSSVLPMAAWIRHGQCPETLIDNLEELSGKLRNRFHRWILNIFLKAMIRYFISSGMRTRDQIEDYRKYRKAIQNNDMLEWALEEENSGETEAVHFSKSESLKREEMKDDNVPIQSSLSSLGLQSLIASQDSDMVDRIGNWIKTHSRGKDVARMFIALMEAGEIESQTSVSRFREALNHSFPNSNILGERQIQKDVNRLQTLSPNRKKFGKDEAENRAVIEIIKSEVLKKELSSTD